jgi:hypothetical protein|nr:MAG TPA_asm: hypothetical protein [Caudoviricetes sp.]DAR00327.1 MAG TPA: hypothetical protein [Caudoviricetes sp.]
MKDFIDRVPLNPGRRKITYEDGTSEYVTVEMADEPTVVGTPLNRAAFMNLQGFSTEDINISESGNVITVTINHKDGGKTVITITATSDTLTNVVLKYTGNTGLVMQKNTTIDTSGSTIKIGGVTA